MVSLVDAFWGFVIYNKNTEEPIFSQFNFDFGRYAFTYGLEGKNKNELFTDFYKRFNFDFNLPYNIPDNPDERQAFINCFDLNLSIERKQQIQDYINYNAFSSHYGNFSRNNDQDAILLNQLVKEQFDTLYYSQGKIITVQDYYYEIVDIKGRRIFTKYNFDFDSFCKDFYGFIPDFVQKKISKRTAFTQWVIRNQMTAIKNPIALNLNYKRITYNINSKFEKYFIQYDWDNFNTLMLKNAVSSPLPITIRNDDNINYTEYYNQYSTIIEQYLPQFMVDKTPEEKAHFYWTQYGQFEIFKDVLLIPIKLSPLQKLINSVCIVYSTSKLGSGFRIDGKNNQFYVLTVLNLFSNDLNEKLFLATFSVTRDDGLIENITAEFRIISYDSFFDYTLGQFDESLPFNIKNNVTNTKLSIIPPLAINVNTIIEPQKRIYAYGLFGSINTINFSSGYIIDTTFTGDRLFDDINLYTYLLTDIKPEKGIEGGPMFILNNDGSYSCVSIIQFKKDININSVIGIIPEYIVNYVRNSIDFWSFFVSLYGLNYTKLDQLIDYGYYKSWFGAIGYYNDYTNPYTKNKLSNLNYTGGYILTNIFIGYNVLQKRFVYNTFELNNKNVIRVYSPLENTIMHKRLINSNAPIVIKKLSYLEPFTSNYIEYKLGTYNGQTTLTKFNAYYSPFGFEQTTNPTFRLGLKFQYPVIKFTYSYYDGNTWLDDFEYVGGNDDYWYVSYTNLSQQTFSLHRFQLPYFFVIYLSNIYK